MVWQIIPENPLQCNQRVVELADPMKSFETAGWLRGELRVPT
jgi:hypothetical protein